MKKILVCEDDKFLANAYKVKLKRAGFDVELASNGLEAINSLKSLVPDLILLDLVMPKLDGFAVLEQLNANGSWKNIPVIIASNLGQKEDIDRGLKLGAKDYIIKTDLSMNQLIEKITKVIGQ